MKNQSLIRYTWLLMAFMLHFLPLTNCGTTRKTLTPTATATATLTASSTATLTASATPKPRPAVAAPVLKWSGGGCYSATQCETGWYSSPALVDVNGDGILDIVASAYTVFALNGADGQLIWRAGTKSYRTWPDIVVADLDLLRGPEIIVAQAGGCLTVYNLNGLPKWLAMPVTYELTGVVAADLDGNGGPLEVVVTAARDSAINTWVYNNLGLLRAGWPQLQGIQGYSSGVYNSNLAVGNLVQSDAALELVVPSNLHYISAYTSAGTGVKASATVFPGRTYWYQVGTWESDAVEKRGSGLCNGVRDESYRPNFAESPSVIADVDGDGTKELVVVGNMYDCSVGYPPSRYTALFIFNSDRTRFNKKGFNWQTISRDTGAPLVEDSNIIENAEANPVVVDLDGDGKKEILFSSYDGKVHAFWLNNTQAGYWPYSVYNANEGCFRFASEPAVVDLNLDGKAEVIFTSWTQKGSNKPGRLHIVSWDGQLLYELDLPRSASDWDGALAAPTLGNINADADLELVINTVHTGVVVYHLPGTAGAKVLWATGRGNFQRTGAI